MPKSPRRLEASPSTLHRYAPNALGPDDVSAQGAAGTTFVTYRDAHRTQLVLGVKNMAEESGHFHAVHEARFGG